MEVVNKTINARSFRVYNTALGEYRVDGFIYLDGALAFNFKVFGKAVEK